jgi:hypothetical protein
MLIALGGVSYAALNLPKNSVGAREIEKNAVRSGELKNASVKCADLAAGCGASVVRPLTETIELSCQEGSPAPGTYFKTCSAKETIRAACNAGEHATGGGFEIADTVTSTAPGGTTTGVDIEASKPDSSSGAAAGWTVTAAASGIANGTSPGLPSPPNPSVTVYAQCSV